MDQGSSDWRLFIIFNYQFTAWKSENNMHNTSDNNTKRRKNNAQNKMCVILCWTIICASGVCWSRFVWMRLRHKATFCFQAPCINSVICLLTYLLFGLITKIKDHSLWQTSAVKAVNASIVRRLQNFPNFRYKGSPPPTILLVRKLGWMTFHVV